MVQMPTEADIARAGSQSGRIAPSGVTVGTGAGIAAAGEGLVRAAYSLADLAKAERDDELNKRGNDVSTSLTRFLADEEQRFTVAKDESTESAIGFTRQFMQSHQDRAQAWAKENFQGLSHADQTRFNNSILARGNDLYLKAKTYEDRTKGVYYERVTNEGLDTYRGQIRSNAADFATLKSQGLEQIRSADMPEPWKAERVAAWEADAAEAKWRWKFEQDPVGAVSAVKAPSGSNQGRAYQRLMSKGWTAKQAAGIIGNLVGESGPSLNTSARNPGDGRDGSDSIGIGQWNGSRAKALKRFAAAQGKDWRDLDIQIDFIDHELRTSEKAAGDRLASSATVEEAAAAFISYERPAGWSPGNPRGGHNWSGRLVAANKIADDNPDAEDADFEDIPYERKQALAEWGDRQIAADIRATKAEQASLAAAENDRFRLGIATGNPAITEASILNSQVLDTGDKATLINSLNEKRKDERLASDTLARIENGGRFDPFDADDRKGVGLAYEQASGGGDVLEDDKAQSALRYVVDRAGIVPAKAINQIRAGLLSSDPERVGVAAAMSSRLYQIGRGALEAAPQGQELVKAGLAYRHMTQRLGLSPDDAGRRIIDMSDPEKRRQREALLESKTVKDRIKQIDAGDVGDVFDTGLLDIEPKVGDNDMAQAAIVADYKDIYRESLVDAAGDEELAKDIAAERIKRIYGVSDLSLSGGEVVTKFPPSVLFPPDAKGSHDWIGEQLREQLAGVGVQTSDARLQARPDTSRRNPIYDVYYYDEAGDLQMHPAQFVPDPAGRDVYWRREQEERLNESRENFQRNRETFQETERNVDTAIEQTEGPAWMKAREVERVRELQRSKFDAEGKPEPSGTDPYSVPILTDEMMDSP